MRQQVYVYGALDPRPIELRRRFGFAWGVGGWLLTTYLSRTSREDLARLPPGRSSCCDRSAHDCVAKWAPIKWLEGVLHMTAVTGVVNGILSPVVGLVSVLLRGVLALVVWILATVLLLVSAVLCVTIVLLPVGIPLFAFSVRLYGFGIELITGS